MVLWNIGLSRAGKTTLSRLLYNQLKLEVPNLVLLDGDVIRDLFNNDVDHSLEGRRRNAERLSHLSKFLSDQGIHVVAAVLSIFPEWQRWNRKNIEGYQEVYIKASMEVLLKRDTHGLYRAALNGEIKDVVGVDIHFPEPLQADLVLDNDKEVQNFEPLLQQILSLESVRKIYP
jgi:cytidine diphosphoramidate kinase